VDIMPSCSRIIEAARDDVAHQNQKDQEQQWQWAADVASTLRAEKRVSSEQMNSLISGEYKLPPVCL
jgi:hypothetical protein